MESEEESLGIKSLTSTSWLRWVIICSIVAVPAGTNACGSRTCPTVGWTWRAESLTLLRFKSAWIASWQEKNNKKKSLTITDKHNGSLRTVKLMILFRYHVFFLKLQIWHVLICDVLMFCYNDLSRIYGTVKMWSLIQPSCPAVHGLILSILIPTILEFWSINAHWFLLTYLFGNVNLLLLSPGEITPSWLDEFQQHTQAHKPHARMLSVNFNYKHMAVSSKRQQSLK